MPILLQALRTELTNRQLSAAIAASDENSYTLALSTWNSFSSATKVRVSGGLRSSLI